MLRTKDKLMSTSKLAMEAFILAVIYMPSLKVEYSMIVGKIVDLF